MVPKNVSTLVCLFNCINAGFWLVRWVCTAFDSSVLGDPFVVSPLSSARPIASFFETHYSDIMCLYLGARCIIFEDPIFGQGESYSGTSASFLGTQTLFGTLAESLSDLFYDALLLPIHAPLTALFQGIEYCRALLFGYISCPHICQQLVEVSLRQYHFASPPLVSCCLIIDCLRR